MHERGQNELGGGRARSTARVVGALEPPHGWTFAQILEEPVAERDCLLEFHVRAAKLLGVPPSRVFLQKIAPRSQRERARREPGQWHRDSFTGPGHLIAVVGERATEFLLGDYDERDLGDLASHHRLEATMERWQAKPLDLVLIDRFTVHCRPQLGDPRRIFLLATVDSSVMGEIRARGEP